MPRPGASTRGSDTTSKHSNWPHRCETAGADGPVVARASAGVACTCSGTSTIVKSPSSMPGSGRASPGRSEARWTTHWSHQSRAARRPRTPPRRRPQGEDRIRCAKDTGLRNLAPARLRPYQIWCELARTRPARRTGGDPGSWSQPPAERASPSSGILVGCRSPGTAPITSGAVRPGGPPIRRLLARRMSAPPPPSVTASGEVVDSDFGRHGEHPGASMNVA